jgi:hypothetical protein
MYGSTREVALWTGLMPARHRTTNTGARVDREGPAIEPVQTQAQGCYGANCWQIWALWRKKKAPALEIENWGAPIYGVENANTCPELLIPQTPPPLPTLTETSEPGTCTKLIVFGSKR